VKFVMLFVDGHGAPPSQTDFTGFSSDSVPSTRRQLKERNGRF
jgi:hypothetical protein